MKISRYSSSYLTQGGVSRSTSFTIPVLRAALTQGRLSARVEVMAESSRLDILAGKYLGDATLWWIIAALSNIGWSMQVPPGTRLVIPTQPEQLKAFL